MLTVSIAVSYLHHIFIYIQASGVNVLKPLPPQGGVGYHSNPNGIQLVCCLINIYCRNRQRPFSFSNYISRIRVGDLQERLFLNLAQFFKSVS